MNPAVYIRSVPRKEQDLPRVRPIKKKEARPSCSQLKPRNMCSPKTGGIGRNCRISELLLKIMLQIQPPFVYQTTQFYLQISIIYTLTKTQYFLFYFVILPIKTQREISPHFGGIQLKASGRFVKRGRGNYIEATTSRQGCWGTSLGLSIKPFLFIYTGFKQAVSILYALHLAYNSKKNSKFNSRFGVNFYFHMKKYDVFDTINAIYLC